MNEIPFHCKEFDTLRLEVLEDGTTCPALLSKKSALLRFHLEDDHWHGRLEVVIHSVSQH